jgi:hypothetical protein
MVVRDGSGVETVDLVSLRRLFVPVVGMRVWVWRLCVGVASLCCRLCVCFRPPCAVACAVRKCDLGVVCVWSRLGLCLVSYVLFAAWFVCSASFVSCPRPSMPVAL